MLRKILVTSLISFFATSICFAKNINLYDQPKNDAKVIGAIDAEAGIVPIYTPKTGDWMKVGDPRNGNVGWIKSNDLSSGSSGFSFTEHMTNSGKGPQQYVIQFGTPKPLSAEESAAMFKHMQEQQAAIQHDMQKMFHDIYTNSNAGMMSYPIIVPVIITPQQPVSASDQTKKQVK